jgi:YVTN family beta-propeller protein
VKRVTTLALPVLLLVALMATAAAAETLIVVNKWDNEVALVDASTYEVLKKLVTGSGPHEVAASPDGGLAYVTNYGGSLWSGDTLTVIDVEKKAVKETFDLGSYSRPHGVWASRDGSRLWVTAESDEAVLELEAASGKILKAWKTPGAGGHMLAPTPDEGKLYVANPAGGDVTVIDRRTDSVETIQTGPSTEGIDVSPDGRQVWVGSNARSTLTVIDAATDKVVASFSSGGQVPIRVKFSPDGKQVWVSNNGSQTVTVLDVRSRNVLDIIELPGHPVGLFFAPDGSRVFVGVVTENRVVVIDAETRKITGSIATGTRPDGMAWGQ